MEVTLWFGGVLTGFLYNTLPMYMINLIIIYDIYHIYNIFSMKNHESLKKIEGGHEDLRATRCRRKSLKETR